MDDLAISLADDETEVSEEGFECAVSGHGLYDQPLQSLAGGNLDQGGEERSAEPTILPPVGDQQGCFGITTAMRRLSGRSVR